MYIYIYVYLLHFLSLITGSYNSLFLPLCEFLKIISSQQLFLILGTYSRLGIDVRSCTGDYVSKHTPGHTAGTHAQGKHTFFFIFWGLRGGCWVVDWGLEGW